ncbi:MAG: hypothetical protein U0S36_13340 [Candidatus Nanopelagicales bacterium]
MTTVYVPGDSAARAVGADEVALALESEAALRGLPVTVVRNGSRGMHWLEPFVEVVTGDGRVGYGPVRPDDVAVLLDAGLLDGAEHPLRQGPVEQIEWLASQQRVTFARSGSSTRCRRPTTRPTAVWWGSGRRWRWRRRTSWRP